MGLDSVEIVMSWEAALGVTITDAEATVIRTPRMAIDLLAAKLGAIDDARSACLTHRAFNRVRHGLVSGAGVHRAAISPEAKIRDLLPRPQRRARWQAVQAASGLPTLPRLDWGFGFLFAPTTVADLARSVVSTSPQALKSPHEPWTRHEIRTVVRTVVTEVCGAKDFSDDDDFVHDIGLD
ncbi:hypothetical protein SAMN02745166_03857 [Prosthecobacter debontii]|uniref:Carrier domain-containing protein n=1 Tax=Prosthecobacter debontii TaxID=48467 RepID=A0A1T4YPE9_9BACT|nr:hypothetical protein [Prosthecobacter debontii]SKB03616.1 hypothetical protein SAMN02745166_03857 [Prosthecobacter debontii]